MDFSGGGLAEGLAEHLATGIVVLDETLTVLYLNPSAENLLGRSRQQLVGIQLDRTIPGLSRLRPLLSRAAGTGEALARRELTLEWESGDNNAVAMDCNLSVIGEEEGRRCLLVELADASRRLKISRENALLSQLDVSRTIVRQLAHEIRNPLGGIRGAAQLLERELEGEEQREYTSLIIREADRLAGLADNLLGPGAPPAPEHVNIHEILEHVYRLSSAGAPAGVEIERDYDPSLPPLTVDRGHVVQALLNLVRNAIQAVAGDGRVVLRSRALTHHTIGSKLHRLVGIIEVEDSGPGVPDEIRDSLFYPLVTGRRDGTGLGLALAQELVSRQGGLIEYTSRPGRTVFQVLIPLEDDEGQDA